MTDDTPTTGPAANDPATKPPGKPVTTVTTGTLIMGTYEIEKLINSGGMGEVYRGRNIHNDELVAIKIVLPSLAHDPKIVALFQKESTVLSRLAHEAIVRYHVFTNDPTIGRPCMVMEFVSGTALSDRIEQGPMPLDEVKVMMRRVASGLDKAHRAGVVHRDLSPDNVILEEGAVEHAKLIDFGIAKSTNFGSGTLLQGQFAGKFNWVSPEQLGAYGGQVDGRSDIYSLALIIAGASRGSVLQMGASIVDAVSKRASVPDMQGVDPALVPLLSWMLEPDPAHRTESMAKVIAALDNPALVPSREPPPAPAPDPNRTVIEPLPVMGSAPVTSGPVTSAPAWEMPPAPQKSDVPPQGAPVIAAQTQAPQPQEPDDASPFSTARTAAAPAPAMVAPVAKSGGKGGMMGVLVLLAVAAGGAGAYFSGVLDGTKPGPAKPAEEQVAASDTPKPAEETVKPADPATDKPAEDPAKTEAEAAAKAEAEAKAAADAQAKADADAKAAEDATAAAKAAEEADAKAKADAEAESTAAKAVADAEAAAKLAAEEVRSQGGAIAAAKAMATAAQAEAEKAAGEAAGADMATVQGLADVATAASAKAKAAADAASAGLAEATKAGLVAKGVEAAAQGVDELLATAGADAKAATDAATAAETASAKAADALRLANEAEAARLAEEKAKEEALQADPVARQQAFLDDFTPPSCAHLRLTEARAEGFALEGFAVDTKPLEALSADWAAATEVTPDIAVHLINEEQCAALDFMNGHRSAPLTVKLTNAGEVVKSGSFIEGVIEGLPHQNIALFVISGAGAATNLKDFVTMGDNGTASFKFALKLVEGQPPAPHVLLAVTADEALVTMLGKLKPGTSIGGTRGLLPFVDKQLTNAGVQPQVGLGFFRLEN